jgi:hypothetical protein
MTMHAVPKAIFDRSLKLVRAPLDIALGAVGASDSAAKHVIDRVEAGTRSATGVLFADEELREEGRAALLAAKERERAARLHEEAELRQRDAVRNLNEVGEESAEARAEARQTAEAERRKAEKRRREREAQAAEAATARKRKAAKSAAKAKRANAKRDKAATLEKLDAKEESIEAKEAAARTRREAKRLKQAASGAKRARKNGGNA